MERINAKDVEAREVIKPNRIEKWSMPRRNKARVARTAELFALARQWAEEGFRVLYLTDDLEYNWRERLRQPCNVDFVFNPDPEEICDAIQAEDDDVVIFDLPVKRGSEIVWTGARTSASPEGD